MDTTASDPPAALGSGLRCRLGSWLLSASACSPRGNHRRAWLHSSPGFRRPPPAPRKKPRHSVRRWRQERAGNSSCKPLPPQARSRRGGIVGLLRAYRTDLSGFAKAGSSRCHSSWRAVASPSERAGGLRGGSPGWVRSNQRINQYALALTPIGCKGLGYLGDPGPSQAPARTASTPVGCRGIPG